MIVDDFQFLFHCVLLSKHLVAYSSTPTVMENWDSSEVGDWLATLQISPSIIDAFRGIFILVNDV